MTPIQTALSFLNALQMRRFDEALELVDEQIVYDNKPLATLRGRRKFDAFLRPWVETHDEISILIRNVVASGDLVIVERIDRDRMAGAQWVSTQAAGFFHIRDRRIVEWRDYYDLNSFCLQNGGDYGEYVRLAGALAAAE